MYPGPCYALGYEYLCLLIAERTHLLRILRLHLQDTHRYAPVVSSFYACAKTDGTMFINTILAIEMSALRTALTPHTLLKQYTRPPGPIYLQLCKPYQVIELSTTGTRQIICSVDRIGSVDLTGAWAGQNHSIVVVQLFVVIPPLIVYELADITHVCTYGNPLGLLTAGSPVLYTKYTVLWVLVLCIQVP